MAASAQAVIGGVTAAAAPRGGRSSSASRISFRSSAGIAGGRRRFHEVAVTGCDGGEGRAGSAAAGGRRPLQVVADVRKEWRSRRSIQMLVKTEVPEYPFAQYIADGERIVDVTFPDEQRREKLDATTWRVQLLPFEFFGNKVVVYCTMGLDPQEDGLHISAKQLEITGLPKEFNIDGKVNLGMKGSLKPQRGPAGAAGRRVMGQIQLNLEADINEFLSMTPGLDDVVNTINDTILANLEKSISNNIIKDYEKWAVSAKAKALT